MNDAERALRTVASMHEQAEAPCMVIVNGKLGQGGRTCSHADGEHFGDPWDARCRGCIREGIPASGGLGPSRVTGYDHAYLNRVPTPPATSERRAA